MSLAELLTSAITAESGPKPRDDELDVFGVTDIGKVRQENQDHFLIATVHQQLVVQGTSFPHPENLPVRGERLAAVFLVADGVGGATAGREASQLTVATIAHYVSSTMRCFQTTGGERDEEHVLASLRAATAEAHQAVRAEATARGEGKMATTMTLVVTVWPRAYVVQVGDSRYYDFSDGRLRLVTRDQTLAQDLVDQGVLPAERLARSPFRNVLARAIGSEEATPEVTLVNLHQDSIGIICSDGLTKHVTDEEIAGQVKASTGSEQLCRSLLAMALERGGSDNVTIVSARVKGH
jgi:serine/threonine protein phosphatase PrpC